MTSSPCGSKNLPTIPQPLVALFKRIECEQRSRRKLLDDLAARLNSMPLMASKDIRQE